MKVLKVVVHPEEDGKNLVEFAKSLKNKGEGNLTLEDSVVLVDGNVIPHDELEKVIVRVGQIIEIYKLPLGG